MKRRGAVLLFAVVAALGLWLVPAGATGRHDGGGRHGVDVLVVDKTPRHHRSCFGTRRPFPTIQAAVNRAGRGDTVWVCPGVYPETVTVKTPHLTIKGANAGRDATKGRRPRESVVTSQHPDGTVRLLANHITWDGFTIRGVREKENGPGLITSKDHSGYLVRDTIFEDNGVGIDLGSNGKHPTVICRNRFVANNEFTAGGGFGVFSGRGAQDVLISGNKFKLHNGSAVFFGDRAGVVQRDIVIEHNQSVDDKTFLSLFNSSKVRVTANLVRARVNDPEFPDRTSAIFIGARNHDVVVQKNSVKSASGNGIDVTNTGASGPTTAFPTNVAVLKNKVEGAQLSGIAVSATGSAEYRLQGNRSTANGQDGIHLALGTDDVGVAGNTALDNATNPGREGAFDCRDQSAAGDGTAGRSNDWLANVGRRSSPRGLCAAPGGDVDESGHGGKGHANKHGNKHDKKHDKVKKQRPSDPCSCGLLFPRRI
jgi:Right handed beta helix region